MKILYINSCVREESRTKILSEYLLSYLKGEVTELVLENSGICALNREQLKNRDEYVENTIDLKLAKQFANADIIVISAPFWDYSFPALLKDYIERINVLDVTFYYENGFPFGCCKAKKLYYVSTAGGPFYADFGYNYIKRLANEFYGIKDCSCIYAENLDMDGYDPEKIMIEAKKTIDDLFNTKS
ncbi:MAG: NAD(P)H-dependent oxidoreductase [Clostridia bacterium]|nr:NAD(P)H-dependent oxidoreductase [Clostridia bacterium]